MKEKFVNKFLATIHSEGHNTASTFMGINHQEFDVFSSDPLFSHLENYQMLENQEQGCYMYNNYNVSNPNFLQNFKNFLGDRIIEEQEIVSDIFNNKTIKVLKVKLIDDDFRLIYELNSADRLRIL